MGIFSDLLGTTKSYFKVGGPSGVRLKNSSGDLLVRNAADGADSAITTSKVNVSGDVVDLNSDAAGSGADWKYTLQRPSTGMSGAVSLTLPPDDGTAGQIMITDGNGVLTFADAGDTGLALKTNDTSLAFGDSSPVAMFSTGAGDVIDHIDIIIDTAFDDVPTMSVGIAGTVSKYVATTDVDLTSAAGTIFRVHPGIAAAGAEALILTYSAASASAGAARVIVFYSTPA